MRFNLILLNLRREINYEENYFGNSLIIFCFFEENFDDYFDEDDFIGL